MNKVTVFHNLKPRFESVIEPQDLFREVGHMMVPPMEDVEDEIMSRLNFAYEHTQNISQTWTKNSVVSSHLGQARSTSVGDVISIGMLFYVVADRGFEKLEEAPKVLRTFFAPHSTAYPTNDNVMVPAYDDLMEAMEDISEKMVKGQEAYVYRDGKLVDRLEYDRMSMESKVAARLVTMMQIFGSLGIKRPFADFKTAVADTLSDEALMHKGAAANQAFFDFENALGSANHPEGRSEEYENARWEYSYSLTETLAKNLGYNFSWDRAPLDTNEKVIRDEMQCLANILDMHKLTVAEYLHPSELES